MAYRFVKIANFNKSFLTNYYNANPDIINQTYQKQYDHIMGQGYNWSYFYQKHLTNLGNEAFEIVGNAALMQAAWMKEFGPSDNSNILLAQLKYYKPEVVFFQDGTSYSAEFFSEVRSSIPSIKILIGFCCCPFSQENLKAFSKLDFILTCSPNFKTQFENAGLKSHLFYHAFETSLLPKINAANKQPGTEFLFIGSFVQNKEFHDARLIFVEELVKAGIPISIFTDLIIDSAPKLAVKQMTYLSIQLLKKAGLGSMMLNIPMIKKLAILNSMPKKQNFSDGFKSRIVNSSVFGLDMLQLLAKSKIGFNIHGGVSGDFAANIRMFEVTGAGSLLMTDHKININDLFIPDTEIVTYKSVSECISKTKWLLENPSECKKIALAGQQKTLESHTLEKRAGLLNEIIKKTL